MLNELLIVERGALKAGIKMPRLHPDVKEVGHVPTLLVRLGANGCVTSVRPVPSDVTPWTLRDGQKNSFPFSKPLLWTVLDAEQRRKTAERTKKNVREKILALAPKFDQISVSALKNWPGKGLLSRLNERRRQLSSLEETDAAVVLTTIDRFLLACKPQDGAYCLARVLTEKLIRGIEETAQDDWLEVFMALLIGTEKKEKWECAGALLFEAEGSEVSIIDKRLAERVSGALSLADSDVTAIVGKCGLKGGEKRPLISGNFHQLNLRILGQTYLFAKNKDIPANDRYGRFSANAMPVGKDVASQVAAAFKALVADEQKGVTWRPIPGEIPKQKDLLLAFVEGDIDAPVAGILGDDGSEEDYSKEADSTGVADSDSIAVYEKRARRAIEAVEAKIGGDLSRTPVRLAIFRKLDLANRKVVYAGAPTVAELSDAAKEWTIGEKNVPPWLTLSVLHKAVRKPIQMSPPHLAPLGVIAFSTQWFIRGGNEQQEAVGLNAAEVLRLFFDSVNSRDHQIYRRAIRILRMVMVRRATLIAGTAHALRLGFEPEIKFNRYEVLRTITILAVLLYKLGRKKENYMSDVAFKLGQLLAVADIVHAGYCADVRGGGLPPSLLGNQVFRMAQTAPVKALAVLCQRWKPYSGWAKKTDSERDRIEVLMKSNQTKQRGWDIKKALREAREMKILADELAPSLANCIVNEIFRAELLLGYIAGPKKFDGPNSDADEEHTMKSEEQGGRI